jgi:two-component system LytT family response regulator
VNAPTSRLRVALVDDEPLARAALRAALQPHDDIEVVGEARDGPEAVEFLRATPVDVVFLDVRMPGLDGFQVLEALESEQRPVVVFVTAFDDHALRAFDVHAVDYLVKPFDDARFESMLDHLRRRVEASRRGRLGDRLEALLQARPGDRPAGGAAPRETTPHTRIQVRAGDHIRFVDVADVRYIVTDGNHLMLHMTTGEPARIRHTLKDLMEVLDPRRFVRIHRSTAVNLDHVREVQPWFSGDYVALMKGGEELRVSRHYRDDLLRTTF